jgi:metal-responsive CopG/Arc/MetJ family transcriptional regulator
MQKERITVGLDSRDFQKVDEIAETVGCSKSMLLRMITLEFIRRYTEEPDTKQLLFRLKESK